MIKPNSGKQIWVENIICQLSQLRAALGLGPGSRVGDIEPELRCDGRRQLLCCLRPLLGGRGPQRWACSRRSWNEQVCYSGYPVSVATGPGHLPGLTRLLEERRSALKHCPLLRGRCWDVEGRGLDEGCL